ncbi:hypothetical protein [Ruegeria atlantica]|uniref:hypothetical protein n=1 Tax=Ruegeria atlantica TaxID=81569 RepID=UPI00147CB6A6|nr:hypothetical protein [Ruegeria atlantica]
MKKSNFLYYAAGGWLFLAVMAGVYFLFQATLPSADVARVSRPTVYTLDVENFEPGQSATFRLDQVPVVIWRRDFKQKVQALELLGVEINGNANFLEEVRVNEEIEIEPDRVLRFEWFVVSPINTGGHGCIALPDAGDLGGFYDPCQDVHFDLWGRVRKGPTNMDLQVLPWSISDDSSAIIVDVSNAPRLE